MRQRLLIAFAGITFLGIVSFMLIKPFNDWSGQRDATLFAAYGTFVYGLFGTILTLVNSILIYITYQQTQTQFQRTEARYRDDRLDREKEIAEDRKNQLEFFKTERFENRLFDMMKTNRDIIYHLAYEVPDEYIPVTDVGRTAKGNKHHIIIVEGQKVLVQIHKHIFLAREECEWILKDYVEFNALFLSTEIADKERLILQSYYTNNIEEALMIKIHWLGIIYLCVFFGLSTEGVSILNKMLKEKYEHRLVDRVIQVLKLKPVKWSDFWGAYEKLKETNFEAVRNNSPVHYENKGYLKFYGGHHHRLGHYFRHLFAIFNYINAQTFISFKQKYAYAVSIRSQFSAYEQSLFFYNSLCSLGRIWEIEAEKNNEVESLIDKRMITKYNLVKNISTEFLADVDLQKVYPLVEFETGKTISRKEELKNKYS